MQPFSLLVKPAGGACNLDCSYCFYKSHPAGLMSHDLARTMLDKYAALPFAAKSIALQGGEPLIAANTGIFNLLDEYPFEKSVQTNATLMTQDAASFFANEPMIWPLALPPANGLSALRWMVHASSTDCAEIPLTRQFAAYGCSRNTPLTTTF